MMKKTILFTFALLSLVTLYRCSTPKAVVSNTPESETALLDIAKKTWPNATAASLAQGKTIYTTKCNTCHGLKPIVGRSEESWKHEIKSMAPKAKLTAEETELLSQYLLSARQLN